MIKYILNRIIALIPVLLGITLLVFLLFSIAPGDPARTVLGFDASDEAIEAFREENGLNDPVLVQYGRYVWNALRGDLGTSYLTGFSVIDELQARLPYTLTLAIVSTVVSLVIGIPLGILAATHQNSALDGASMVVSLVGISLPSIWLSLLLILLFSVRLEWLPSSGVATIQSYILPVLAMSLYAIAAIARTTRSAMLEVLRSDYIRTANGKGVAPRRVIFHHALQNAMIPILTITGFQISALIAGAILIEKIFALPGLGRFLVSSVQDRDIPCAMGCVLVFALSFALINLIVDLLYAVVDPRIKAQYRD